MSELLRIDLFVEDRAHESFIRPLLERVAREENWVILCQVRSARGGRPRVFREFKLYNQHLVKNIMDTPDLLVVAVDSNCSAYAKTKRDIEGVTDANYRHILICACPDPHIERWYMADPNSFYNIVGCRPELTSKKCVRDHYKQLLNGTIIGGDNPTSFSGIELASELVSAMDLYQAGRTDASLKAFLDDLRNWLKTRH